MIFENWKQDVVRPIFVSLATAFLLFLASLMFKPVRQWLFPANTIRDYPLICTAEPFVAESNKRMGIDFFVINRTGEEYTREKLVQFLRQNNPDPEAPLSPDITLTYWRKTGRVESASLERGFNEDKGELVPTVDPANTVQIRVNHVRPRAVMKVTILVTELPDLQGITRTAKSLVPFKYQEYQDACYSRGP